MAVERVSQGFGIPALQRRSVSGDVRALGGEDVLVFLFDLRVDRRKCYSLNSGSRLLREAAERGLVDGEDVEPFIAQMLELREEGLADWTPATQDVWGSDLLHAAEFHLTAQGQSRLRAIEHEA